MDEYRKYYQEQCFSVDARTFSDVKARILEYIKDSKCPANVKILFGDWLFRKIYMNYKPPSPVRKEICNDLIPAVAECDQIVTKSEYLKFHDMIAMSLIALHFYTERFADKDKFFILQLLNDTQLIKNYLQDPRFSHDDLKRHFLKWIREVPIFEQRSNILDVLLRNYGNDEEVNEVYETMRWGKDGEGSIYADEQNVHDKSIRQSVSGAAGALLEWYRQVHDAGKCLIPDAASDMDWVATQFQEMYTDPPDFATAKAVLERSKIDTTVFHSGDVSFSIANILVALLHYINYSESKEALIGILLEEMKGMVELCSSGYVARFLNVLQGFDERFAVTISPEKQLFAVISYAISKGLEKAPETVIAGSIETEHRIAYLSFIGRIVKDEMTRLIKDYGHQDITLYLADIVTRLSGAKCTFIPGTLTLKMRA